MKHPEFKQYSNEGLHKLHEQLNDWKVFARGNGGILKLDDEEITTEEINDQLKKIKEELDDRFSRSKLRIL